MRFFYAKNLVMKAKTELFTVTDGTAGTEEILLLSNILKK
jgi:hypothetical protein